MATYGTSGSGDLEIIAAGTVTNTQATQIATGVSVGASSSMALDTNNNIWLSNGGSTGVTLFSCSAKPCTAYPTSVGQTGSQSVVVDHSNNIWIGNTSNTAGTMTELASTTTPNPTFNAVSGSAFSGGGLLNPTRAIFGGQGNQWITNYASGAGTVTELSSAGAALSPSVGFAHTFAGAEGIAIDASGNIWIGNLGASAPVGFITEIVGAAGPAITPFSANLPAMPGGANTIGMRP